MYHQNETIRLGTNAIRPTEATDVTVYKHLITRISLTVYSNPDSSDAPCVLKSNITRILQLKNQ